MPWKETTSPTRQRDQSKVTSTPTERLGAQQCPPDHGAVAPSTPTAAPAPTTAAPEADTDSVRNGEMYQRRGWSITAGKAAECVTRGSTGPAAPRQMSWEASAAAADKPAVDGSISLEDNHQLYIPSPGATSTPSADERSHMQPVEWPLDEPLGLEYLAAWPMLLWTAIGLATVAITFWDPISLVDLDRTDRWAASWYLINGCFFNSMMDVFAGQFQSWQTMTHRYNELEPRYAMPGDAGVTVQLTSLQELFIQVPLGLTLFYAYHKGCSWRLPAEVAFCMWSVAGVWYFYGSEVMLGFPHVHSPWSKYGTLDLVDTLLSFDMLYKFWLGFVFFPLLWAIMGILLAVRASFNMAAIAAASVNEASREE